MKSVVLFLSCFAMEFFGLSTEGIDFSDLGKEEVICRLDRMTNDELWDISLTTMSALFCKHELGFFSSEPWWIKAQTVLHLGSRTGCYLSLFSQKFPEKHYVGLEKKKDWVHRSQERYGDKIRFLEGDPEEFRPEFLGQYDVVFFHMTLQYMRDPFQVLSFASQYLREGGHIVIIGTVDSAQSFSHQIPSLKDSLAQLTNRMGASRKVTLEIANRMPFSDCTLEFSNLDSTGHPLATRKQIEIHSLEDRRRYFTSLLLFAQSMIRQWSVPVEMGAFYDDARVLLNEKDAWVRPSTHLLLIRKETR